MFIIVSLENVVMNNTLYGSEKKDLFFHSNIYEKKNHVLWLLHLQDAKIVYTMKVLIILGSIWKFLEQLNHLATLAMLIMSKRRSFCVHKVLIIYVVLHNRFLLIN